MTTAIQEKMMSNEWVGAPSPDSSYASSATNSGSGSNSPPKCEISLLERLIRTHPLWFLPSLQRSGALHLLQGREVGNFIVRSSREPDTMALSVKLSGNQVEHYLLRATEETRIALQDSDHSFPTVHQLIAHYCENRDEIPVYLRVPSPIAEAQTRQQLRSLALLGQEFWTISSPVPPREPYLGSPSDADSSQSHALPSKSSGIGSQSSSSQNSLSDLGKKPCRPTTLELGRSRALLNSTGIGMMPLSVPIVPQNTRWSITPTMSQPSSVQSTPSEMQSSISERLGIGNSSRNGNHNHRRRKHFGKSIHYKDTEILDLFKGTKSILDDKVSDYEDVWSTNPHTPNSPATSRRLYTFKPDVIPNGNVAKKSHTPETELQYHQQIRNHANLNQSKSLNLCMTPTIPEKGFVNNRLSLKNINVNLNEENKKESQQFNKSLYSEPLDAIQRISKTNLNHSQAPLTLRPNGTPISNNRWSQPALSLANPNFLNTRRKTLHANNLRQTRNFWGSQSTDNLNRVDEVSDLSVKIKCHGRRTPQPDSHSTFSKSWQVDNSWLFCPNLKPSNAKVLQEKDRNAQNLRISPEDGKPDRNARYSTHSQPMTPSAENWDHLLRLINESSKELENLELNVDIVSSYNSLDAANAIRHIVEELSKRETGVFGPTVKTFITCTLLGKQQDPFKVLRNIRQFISGMKNYLVGINKESEQIHKEIKKQSEKLKSFEFLNVDRVLEQILIDLIVQPLYNFVMSLLQQENMKSSIPQSNSGESLRNSKLGRIYSAFEDSTSPISKLDRWNEFVCEVQEIDHNSVDFFALLVDTLSTVCSASVESHADFVVGLLPHCISERNGHSISLLQSAVSTLKLGRSQTGMGDQKSHWDINRNPGKGLTCIRIIVPDEMNGTLLRKVVPVKDSTTTRDVAKILSSKLGIMHESDYVLVKVHKGEESICLDTDLIQGYMENETTPALAYRRVDAKIGWPLKIN